MKDQKKTGAVLSYFNILLSTVSNFVLIPLMIAALSDDEYSIYKVMQSFSGPLIMLNLGISTITARSIAKYRAVMDGDKKEKENTLALALLIAGVMAVLIMLISAGMCRLLPVLYGETYSPEMLEKAKQIFVIFAVTTAVRILNDTFKGCILGNERFICFYGETTFQYIARFGTLFVLLHRGTDAVAVAMVDLVICVALLVFDFLYVRLHLGERFRLYSVDKRELKSIASFSAAILLQAVVNQVNNNMDVVLLGTVVVNKEIITMYSSALSIYAIYNSVISVFVNIYLPKATRLVMQDRTGEELTDFVIGPGRVQAVIAVGILTGFGLFGKNFISIWIGDRYQDAYSVAMMLMGPVTIPLVQNVCLSILDAKLKRLFRSATLVIMAVINVILSIILVRFMGFWGAALGTVISLLVGHGLLMNLYYHKIIGLNVPRMFREIFAGILPAGLLSGLCCVPLVLLMDNSFGAFVIKCAIFVILYVAALWLIGLNRTEKKMVTKMINRKA